MNLEEAKPRTDSSTLPAHPQPLGGVTPADPPHASPTPICPGAGPGDGLVVADLNFLFEQAQILARMLARTPAETIEATWPSNLHEPEGSPKAPRPEQAVFELLMLGSKSLLIEQAEHKYHFRYKPSGQRLGTAHDMAREPVEIHRDAVPHLAFLANLEMSLSTLLGPAGPSP